MVGVLLDPKPDVIPPIREMLGQKEMVAELKLRPAAYGLVVIQPSALFSAAGFDTKHERDPALAPSHCHIRVAHFFLPYGYPTTTKKPKGPKV